MVINASRRLHQQQLEMMETRRPLRVTNALRAPAQTVAAATVLRSREGVITNAGHGLLRFARVATIMRHHHRRACYARVAMVIFALGRWPLPCASWAQERGHLPAFRA